MAVTYLQEFAITDDDRSTTNYDEIARRLGDVDTKGLIVHTAGFDEEAGVFRIFDVWDSQEDGQRFIDEQLMPIVQELMGGSPPPGPPPTREYFYELHNVVKP